MIFKNPRDEDGWSPITCLWCHKDVPGYFVWGEYFGFKCYVKHIIMELAMRLTGERFYR